MSEVVGPYVPPDAAVREEALDPSSSFIVQAPAGSGKTGLLIQRYMRLLSLVEEPEEALAITFTRKAAGEMRCRVMDALTEAAGALGEDGAAPGYEARTRQLAAAALKRDAEKGWGILENPSRLRILTIDALQASIARQLPLLTGLGRMPSITEHPEELCREAARRTIAMLSGPEKAPAEAVRKALAHLDNFAAGLEERLSSMLMRRDQWLRHIRGPAGADLDMAALRGALEASIRNLVEESLREARAAVPERFIGSIIRCASYAGQNLQKDGAEGGKKKVAALAGIAGLPSASADEMDLWKGLAGLLLTDKGEPRSPKGINVKIGFPPGKKGGPEERMKAEFQTLLDAAPNEGLFIAALNKAASLPPPCYDDRDWEALEAIIALLPLADGHLKSLFSEAGSLDHAAVSMAAIGALGGAEDPTDLLLALDVRIRHILVDEYQDTSRAQLGLLAALTSGWEEGDGRTLFIVGDPMQSIYLFREAEVGLFLEARSGGINQVRLKSLKLTANFRSQARLVEWANALFSAAFPSEEDPFTGSVPHEPSVAARPALEGDAVKTEVFDSGSAAREETDEAEARMVADIIETAGADETVAVLARSRPHLDAIVLELERRRIPFRADQFLPLSSTPVVQDLLCLLRALVHPYDRVAWLSVLRAPWCGLKLADIHALVSTEPSAPVLSLLVGPERSRRLSLDAAARVERVAAAFSKALDLFGRVEPRRLLEGLWMELGGPASYANDPSGDAALFFDALESVSSGSAVGSVGKLKGRLDGLYSAAKAEGTARVEIMTIHKAKGLEFDRVIIPGAGKRVRNSEKRLLLWLERGGDLLLAPIEKKGEKEGALYGYMKGLAAEKEALERTRLFYVAATRAKKRLHIFGSIKGPDDAAGPKTLLSVIPPSILANYMVHVPATANGPEDAGQPDGAAYRVKRLASGWRAPEPAGPIASRGEDEAARASARLDPVFDWAGAAVRMTGTAVHRFLARIASDGPGKWSAARVDAERPAIVSMLRSLGLGAREAGARSHDAVAALKNALSDPRGLWVLRQRPGAAVEMAVTGLVDDALVRAVIDRTFIDERGVRWVVDFKTGVHLGGSVEEFLKREKQRYEAQLEAYRTLLKASGEKREIRRALYYPALTPPAWIEW